MMEESTISAEMLVSPQASLDKGSETEHSITVSSTDDTFKTLMTLGPSHCQLVGTV